MMTSLLIYPPVEFAYRSEAEGHTIHAIRVIGYSLEVDLYTVEDTCCPGVVVIAMDAAALRHGTRLPWGATNTDEADTWMENRARLF